MFWINRDGKDGVFIFAFTLPRALIISSCFLNYLFFFCNGRKYDMRLGCPRYLNRTCRRRRFISERDGVCTPSLTFGVVRSQLKRYGRGKCPVRHGGIAPFSKPNIWCNTSNAYS